MEKPKDKVSYTVICENSQYPCIFFNDLKSAIKWAKFDQPLYRPYYIIKRVEKFELCGILNKKGQYYE